MDTPATSPHLGAITRRAALGVLGAGAAGFVLLGPRGGGEASRGRVVVDYWEKWTGHEGRAMQGVVDEFNASQDRVWVRYYVTANIGQKALIAIAGGSPPDIVGLWSFNVPAYAQSGAILPLDELAQHARLRLDQYRSGVQRVMTHACAHRSGRWWGVVNTAGTLALYLNRAVFRDAGLDPDRPPRTIEELDACHRAITRRRGDGVLERVGFLHLEPGWWSWVWGYYFGGGVYDEAHDAATFDSPANVQAYRWMQSYPRELAGDAPGARAVELFRQGFGNYNTPQNAFLDGRVGMVLQGPWLANIIRAYAPGLDYAVAPFPVEASAFDERAPVALVDTDVLCVPAGAKNPEAAMAFIAFTQRREITERLAIAHGKISPLRDVSAGFVAGHPNRGVAVHNALAESPRAFVAPPTRAWPEIKDDTDSVVQKLWRLEVDPPTALAGLQARATLAIARAARQSERRYGSRA